MMKRGRPKGHSPYVDISYEELGDWVGRKSLVKVSRAWLQSIGAQIEHRDEAREIPPKEEPKIEFNLIDLNNE
tara:strand:- start:398 stop:616 length:219 start_codon:yes stop_codon:yes gene_type:complete